MSNLSLRARTIFMLASILLLLARPAQAQQQPRTSGTITSTDGAVTLTLGTAGGTAVAALTGTWTATLNLEVSADCSTFVAQPLTETLSATPTVGATTTSNGTFLVPLSGFQCVRVRANPYASGTVSVVLAASASSAVVNVGAALPTGSNTIGAVTGSGTFTVGDGSGALTVDGTVAATQSGTWNVTNVSGTVSLPTGAATESTLSTLSGKIPSAAVLADNTANPTTFSSGAFAHIFDGSTWDRWTGGVSQTGTWNLTNISGTISLPTGASTLAEQQTQTTALQLIDNLPVAQGSTTSGQSGALVQGAVTTGAPTYTNNQTSPLSLTTAGAVRTDSSATTQPISGSVTANAGTNLNTSALALDATLTGRLPAGASPADNESNTNTSLSRFGAFNFVFDGSTWDRWTGGVSQTGTWTVQPGNTANTTPWLFSISQGGNTASVNASSQLSVNCANCSGSGVSHQDGAAFTPDTSNLVPVGGYRDDTAPATVTEGDAAAARVTEFRALHVNLRDASGNELAVGGGTQYTEDAAAAANPVATALNLVRDDARGGSLTTADGDNVAARGTNAGELYVKHVDTIAVTQSGGWTVTANAGTNLNTSTLALESGGNLATVAGAVRAEDAASANAHTGIGALAVQKATPANTGGTDGDYEFLQMSAGRLWASATIDAAIPAGNNNIGDVDVASLPSVTIGTFPDNEPFNVAQINGVAPSMGNGASGTGVQRVTIANDSTGILASVTSVGSIANALPAGTNNIGDVDIASLPSVTVGTFPDNEPFNLAQVAGATTSTGVGVSDSGTQRVSLSYDGAVTLQSSQVSAITNTTTTRTTTTGLGPYVDASVLINITNGGAATGTLQLYLQDSCDGGTTWNDWVSSNTFTFGAAVITQQFFVAGRLATSSTQGAAAAVETLAAGTARQGPFCDRVRVREKVSGVGGSPTGVTYTIGAVFKR